MSLPALGSGFLVDLAEVMEELGSVAGLHLRAINESREGRNILAADTCRILSESIDSTIAKLVTMRNVAESWKADVDDDEARQDLIAREERGHGA